MSTCRTIFTSIIYHLQMPAVPFLLRKCFFQMLFCKLYRPACDVLPSVSQSLTVRIHTASRTSRSLHHIHRSSFVSHTGKGFECLKILWYFSIVLLFQYLRKLCDGFRFLRRQSDRADDFPNLFYRKASHFPGIISFFK